MSLNSSEVFKVLLFHMQFNLPVGGTNLLFNEHGETSEAFTFRAEFLMEELQEFIDAAHVGDRVKALDALIDLVYVALGTSLFMGVHAHQWDEAFDVVHRANMTKIRTPRPADSKRGSGFDVIKPEGFVPPEGLIRRILGE
jgi:predicted HAD superfamily Cof-like phosphohydrolase